MLNNNEPFQSPQILSIGSMNDQFFENIQSKRAEFCRLDKVRVSNDQSEVSILSQESDEVQEDVQGFKNKVWKERALNVIVLIARFITHLLTNSDKFKLRYLELRQFKVINDKAADYDYYLNRNLIRDRRKKTFFWNLQKFIFRIINWFRSFGCSIKPIKPDNEWKLLWDIVVFTILLINIVYIPLKISFTLSDIPDGVDLFLDTFPQYVFLVEILLNFNVAYYSRGVLVLDLPHIVQHYLKGKFILDFIVLIPFMIGRSNVPYIEFVLLFRVSRVMSIFENIVESYNLRVNFAAFIDILSLLSMFLFVSHLIACVWHFIGIQELQSSPHILTWISKADLDEEDWLSRYVTSFYWACITTLTIGYGDITPETNIEKLFVIFVALCSSIIFGYTISSIGQIFAQMSESKKLLRDKMTMIDNFVKKRGLDKTLQVKVKKFFEYYLKMKQDKDSECEKLMEHLSGNLNKEVKIDFYKTLLNQSKLFRQNFQPEFIEKLCIIIKEQSFVPEELIVQEGQQVDKIFFVLKGEIEAFISNNKSVKTYRRQQVIYEKSFISQHQALFSTKALKFSRLAYFTFEDLHKLLETNPQDREHYFKVRHLIEFGGRVKFQGCELCYQNHDFTKCPFVFYTPSQARISRNIAFSEHQPRRYVERKAKEDYVFYNSKGQFQQLKRNAVSFGHMYGLYQDLSPNDEFFQANKTLKSATLNLTQFQEENLSQNSDSERSHNQNVGFSQLDIVEQIRAAKRDSTSFKKDRVSICKKLIDNNNNGQSAQNVGGRRTNGSTQKRPTLLLQQIRMNQSIKPIEQMGEQASPSQSSHTLLDIDQVKWIEMDYAKMMSENECNVDLQQDLQYYNYQFNFENVTKSLSKIKKQIVQKRKKQQKIKRSLSQLQSTSNKNLNQLS